MRATILLLVAAIGCGSQRTIKNDQAHDGPSPSPNGPVRSPPQLGEACNSSRSTALLDGERLDIERISLTLSESSVSLFASEGHTGAGLGVRLTSVRPIRDLPELIDAAQLPSGVELALRETHCGNSECRELGTLSSYHRDHFAGWIRIGDSGHRTSDALRVCLAGTPAASGPRTFTVQAHLWAIADK